MTFFCLTDRANTSSHYLLQDVEVIGGMPFFNIFFKQCINHIGKIYNVWIFLLTFNFQHLQINDVL